MHGNARFFTRHQDNMQSRLDRFYASKSIDPHSEYTLPGLLSDHDIVILVIRNITTFSRGKGTWKNNTALYNEQAFKNCLQYKWRQWCTLHPVLFKSKATWWTHIKTKLKDLLQRQARRRQYTERRRETNLRRMVETLCREVNNNPTLIPMYHHLKKQWSELQKDQINAKVKKSKTDQFENSDKGTKAFFQQFKEHRRQTTIKRLRNPGGRILVNKEDILQEAHRFFQALYQERATCPTAQSAFLRSIKPTLNPNDDDLTRPITVDEVYSTISQIATGKSPGPDGLTIEFYRQNWEIIAQDLTLLETYPKS